MKNVEDRNYDPGPFEAREGDDLIVCRCEEVSQGEIRQAIHEGMFTLTEIKRFIRPGMGPCQGQRCQPLVRRILAKELGISPDSLETPTSRPPVRPTRMQVLADEIISTEKKLEEGQS